MNHKNTKNTTVYISKELWQKVFRVEYFDILQNISVLPIEVQPYSIQLST